MRQTLDAQRAWIAYRPVALDDGEAHHVHAWTVSRSWGADLLDSHTFQNCMAVVIILNAAVIGMETDLQGWIMWDVAEAVFLVIFLGEVGFKMYVEGYLFFYPTEPDFWWNIFDFFIVGLGCMDCIAETTGLQASGGSVTITLFRAVRLLRVLRILRLIKVLKRLYLLAVGLIEACKAIVFVTILMSMILYVFAIVLVNTVGSCAPEDPHSEFMYAHFHSIPISMLTLFILMSSPNLPVYQEQEGLLDSRPLFCVFLVLFITFGSFGMIAMLTGVINESMFENNELRQQEKREMHESMRLSLGTKCADLYEKLPLDGEGRATLKDLESIAVPAALLLDQTGITIAHGDITKFFRLMDPDETGFVTLMDFVQAMERAAEGLSPLAMVQIQHDTALCNKKVHSQIDSLIALEEKYEKIAEHISDEVDRLVHAIESSGTQHQTNLVEKVESQVQHTSQEVDRIVRLMSDGHNQNRCHLEEKLEAHMLLISKEVDRVLQVVAVNARACKPSPDAETQLELEIQGLPDVRGREPTAFAAPSREIADVACHFESILDKKFLTLEKSLAQNRAQNGSIESLDAAPPEPKLFPESRFEPKIDQILSAVDILCRKEDVVASLIASLRIDFARLLQESKNAVVRAERSQEAVDENVDFLTRKVSTMQEDADSLQARVMNSIAELGGDLISKVSDLICQSLITMKQELVMQRFHASSALSRELTSSSAQFSPPFSREMSGSPVRHTARMDTSSIPTRANFPQ